MYSLVRCHSRSQTGFSIPPNIFICFIDELATMSKEGISVDIDNDEKLCILMYADDVVQSCALLN